MCYNCNIRKSVIGYFCDSNCRIVYQMRLEKAAYFQNKLKYPEFITEMKRLYDLTEKPSIKSLPSADYFLQRGDFFS